MKDDPVENRMRELAWRRDLTDAEKAELRRWLALHPDNQEDWENEAQLSGLLDRLPDVPVPSNFTARVLQAVDREASASAEPTLPHGGWWWRIFVPRAAAIALILGVGLLAFQQHQLAQRKKVAQSLMVVASVEPFSNPAVLEDFDAIRRLTPATAPDKELLALFQ